MGKLLPGNRKPTVRSALELAQLLPTNLTPPPLKPGIVYPKFMLRESETQRGLRACLSPRHHYYPAADDKISRVLPTFPI